MKQKLILLMNWKYPVKSLLLGSEAAAATAVIMNRCMAMPVQKQPVEFKADRPFLFYIRERQQNLTLFSGRFVTPPASS